ncbi:MAG TPA: hypothetical protein VG737_08910 [Cyclobacteriaceae bacterium]|nr:hypothetical protein [Cyclobacteriaceae bacterium]
MASIFGLLAYIFIQTNDVMRQQWIKFSDEGKPNHLSEEYSFGRRMNIGCDTVYGLLFTAHADAFSDES